MFSKKNLKEGSFVLVLDKPFYLCGEKITGHVCLNLEEAIDPFKITMKLKGKEKTSWTIQRTREVEPGNPEAGHEVYNEDHGSKKVCFKKDRTLFEQESPLNAG